MFTDDLTKLPMRPGGVFFTERDAELKEKRYNMGGGNC